MCVFCVLACVAIVALFCLRSVFDFASVHIARNTYRFVTAHITTARSICSEGDEGDERERISEVVPFNAKEPPLQIVKPIQAVQAAQWQ